MIHSIDNWLIINYSIYYIILVGQSKKMTASLTINNCNDIFKFYTISCNYYVNVDSQYYKKCI